MVVDKHGFSDIDAIYAYAKAGKTKKENICNNEKGRTLYIDARTVKGAQMPYDRTGDILNKVSPQLVYLTILVLFWTL